MLAAPGVRSPGALVPDQSQAVPDPKDTPGLRFHPQTFSFTSWRLNARFVVLVMSSWEMWVRLTSRRWERMTR